VRQAHDCVCWFPWHCKLNKAAGERFGEGETGLRFKLAFRFGLFPDLIRLQRRCRGYVF
jgi:hypothetical protein